MIYFHRNLKPHMVNRSHINLTLILEVEDRVVLSTTQLTMPNIVLISILYFHRDITHTVVSRYSTALKTLHKEIKVDFIPFLRIL